MDLPFLDAAEILGRRWEREEGRDESETEEEEEEEEEGGGGWVEWNKQKT